MRDSQAIVYLPHLYSLGWRIKNRPRQRGRGRFGGPKQRHEPRQLGRGTTLDVVIQVELVGMRAHPDGIGLHFFLVVDPELDEFLGEHAAFE